MFWVEVTAASSCKNTTMFFTDLTLEKATYNCPCVKTLFNKYKPAKSRVWPWLLFIVMAKAGFIGNWILTISIGKLLSDGIKESFESKCLSPFRFPVLISTSIKCVPNRVIFIRVPLHKPYLGLMFLNKITGWNNFSCRRCGGTQLRFTVAKNSGG